MTPEWNTTSPDQFPSMTVSHDSAVFRPWEGCTVAADAHRIEVAVPNGQLTAQQATLLGDALAQAATVTKEQQ